MKKHLYLGAAFFAAALLSAASAEEGMFTPEQMPALSKQLKQAGLKISPNELADLTGFPMGAVISLGGCTASFVSPQGLAVTNHHCARGSVQYNSNEEHNYLETGFLADDLKAELPAAPGSRIYVTQDIKDVTDDITGDLSPDLTGLERYEAIDQRRKDLTAQCEEDPGHRCQVASFFGGLQYKLIKRLEIRDVRLVYAPGDSIGKYGGDVDNWMWPRHTGDFSFYRAYVGPDGKPADYSEDNVPFHPEHFLKVSAAGLEDGDFVMAAGYPGSTSRYARLVEVKNTFDWLYPTYVDIINGWIDTIEKTAPEGSDARIKYEARLSGLNNVEKNFRGQIAGARRVDLVGRRAAREAALADWIAADPSHAAYSEAIARVDQIAQEQADASRKNFWYNNATRPQLLGAAQRLYRLAKEHQKPNAERESGYQERDETFMKQSLTAIDRRYDPAVDKAEWIFFLKKYLQAPAVEHVAAFDKAMGITSTTSIATLSKRLDRYYQNTTLGSADKRLDLMSATPADLEKSNDPFMQLAVALYDTEIAMENDRKKLSEKNVISRPDYMAAIIAWQKQQGKVTYPDANSTLRITFGKVMGGSPQDGLIYEPFTRIEGIAAKNTGEWPFNAPERELKLIDAKDYGAYKLDSIGSVPVNFLTDLDSTGGNSGSPTLNARGELVGLLFDGTFESVNSDWDFDPRTTRTIHLDTRYMLWVMEKVDHAQRLIDEMSLVRR